MGTIAQQIVRLQGASGDIKTAIHAQGVPVPSYVKMDGIAPYIEQINTGVHDLSYYDVFGNFKDKQNTANSYVVRDTGKYKIPLVYGCGIKNGKINALSYIRQGTNYTSNFVNYKGNVITSPYIETDTSETAASAGLLWQTAVGMITSVSIVNGVNCRYLQFNVGSVPATNGLAVLWIKDTNGDIMWSWTIWATSDDLSTFKLTNHTEVEYEMLGLPFGAIWNANRDHYTLPYYQWGRKDPMPHASAYNSVADIPLYDISGNIYDGYSYYGIKYDSDTGGTVRSVANSIKMPNRIFAVYNETYRNWNSLSYFVNYWNASQKQLLNLSDDQSTAIKTIYDPSPVGFMVPAGKFSTGFTTTGEDVISVVPENCNVIGEYSYGWNFKKDAEDIVGVFFPCLGYREYEYGALSNVGASGFWDTYGNKTSIYCAILRLSETRIEPQNNNGRSYGFNVWPTKDLINNSGITAIEYLESSGTQYIDTGQFFSDNYAFEIDFDGLGGVTSQTIIGSRDGQKRTVCVFRGSRALFVNIGADNSNTTPFNLGNYTSGRVKVKFRAAAGKGSVWVNDSLLYDNISLNGEYLQSLSSVTIFANNFGNGDLREFATCRVYGVKFWQGDTLVKDLRPSRIEDVGYFYDNVTGGLFDNSGTGNFTLGPDL